MKKTNESAFEKAAKTTNETGLIAEFVAFLKINKKWWLTPILLMFLVFGLLVALSSTGVAPFIYSLF